MFDFDKNAIILYESHTDYVGHGNTYVGAFKLMYRSHRR